MARATMRALITLMGAAMEPQTVPLGSQFILPESGFDAPEGYEFAGWTVRDAEKQAGDGFDVTENTTVTALWAEHQHVMIHEPGHAADCVTPGMMEHWYCPGCGKYFGDANALFRRKAELEDDYATIVSVHAPQAPPVEGPLII